MSADTPHEVPPQIGASTREKIRGLDWSAVIDLLPLLLKAFQEFLRRREDDSVVPCDTLALTEVVGFFAAHRAANPAAAAGAVLRSRKGAAVRVDLMFLDGEHRPLLVGPGAAPTASYLARRLDPELAEAFGKTDIIVLD